MWDVSSPELCSMLCQWMRHGLIDTRITHLICQTVKIFKNTRWKKNWEGEHMGTWKFITYLGNDTLSLAWPEFMGVYGKVGEKIQCRLGSEREGPYTHPNEENLII